MCPYQVSTYDRANLTRELAISSVYQASHGTVQVQKDDTVLVMSDGVFDNIGMQRIEQFVLDAWKDWVGPDALAERLVDASLAPNVPKPDDTTCVVAYVMVDNKRNQ